MRDAFGGTFMIKLVLIFIVIYISFMAVAINYAKVFRVKNNVINILEQNQFLMSDDDIIVKIEKYLDTVPYNVSDGNNNNSVINSCGVTGFGSKHLTSDGMGSKVLTPKGICIEQMDKDDNDIYYRVTAYIAISFPFFNIYLTIPISGETKIISV